MNMDTTDWGNFWKKKSHILVLSFSSQIPTDHIYVCIKRSHALLKHEGYLTAA